MLLRFQVRKRGTRVTQLLLPGIRLGPQGLCCPDVGIAAVKATLGGIVARKRCRETGRRPEVGRVPGEKFRWI
jgi:hypothetical protein